MKIAVLANDEQWQELTNGLVNIDWVRITSSTENVTGADAFIILKENDFELLKHTKKTILLNAVTVTLKALNAPGNVIRINGWNGFLSRKKWEVAGLINDDAAKIFSVMQKEIFVVADTPGLVAARPVAMIINEAYFALEQNVSTKTEIDIAMKLGTNYPFGPFEWADIIGLRSVYELLQTLSKDDKRYIPSRLLKKEAAV